ncbi:helix-turn-helix domain-containing protein [uncultured Clostridium sp.]|uniref:helix-turn-helix domain-containing protein n=1 Tax=uncultured Clostridium sp. TaxID=59620 RepID=UPI0025FB863E|nr:helix-turn-helix domain-containing protein [uncultured Clostridium sp.]
MEDILYTVKEASKLLKTDEATIRRLINKGLIKALRLGRIKIRKVEIERFTEWAEGKDLNDLDNIKEFDYAM